MHFHDVGRPRYNIERVDRRSRQYNNNNIIQLTNKVSSRSGHSNKTRGGGGDLSIFQYNIIIVSEPPPITVMLI